MTRVAVVALGFFAAILDPPSAAAVSFSWAVVGNPGNGGDRSVLGVPGSVGYAYRISTTEVTNAQYVEFLNAVAAADPYALYSPQMGSDTRGGITRSGSPGSYEYVVKAPAIGKGPGRANYDYAGKPVVFVSREDAMRMANWMHNGQGSGDTEHGAYDMPLFLRRPGARVFVPTRDEWHKAAYHKNDGATNHYWRYPTASDDRPDNKLPTLDSGNSANFLGGGTGNLENDVTTGSSFYPFTDVGAYALSESAYGTFDQGGNVSEIVQNFSEVYGGNWERFDTDLTGAASTLLRTFPYEYRNRGFRLAAAIPEPDSVILSAAAALILTCSARLLRVSNR